MASSVRSADSLSHGADAGERRRAAVPASRGGRSSEAAGCALKTGREGSPARSLIAMGMLLLLLQAAFATEGKG